MYKIKTEIKTGSYISTLYKRYFFMFIKIKTFETYRDAGEFMLDKIIKFDLKGGRKFKYAIRKNTQKSNDFFNSIIFYETFFNGEKKTFKFCSPALKKQFGFIPDKIEFNFKWKI